MRMLVTRMAYMREEPQQPYLHLTLPVPHRSLYCLQPDLTLHLTLPRISLHTTPPLSLHLLLLVSSCICFQHVPYFPCILSTHKGSHLDFDANSSYTKHMTFKVVHASYTELYNTRCLKGSAHMHHHMPNASVCV